MLTDDGRSRLRCRNRSSFDPHPRTLPAAIDSSAINYGLQQFARDEHQLFIERTAPWTVHAITSPRYARVQRDELAGEVLALMADHPAWHLPLGYKDGEFGAEKFHPETIWETETCFCSSWTATETSTIPPIALVRNGARNNIDPRNGTRRRPSDPALRERLCN